MNKWLIRFTFLLIAFVASLQSFAQQTKPEMADAMRSNGKIYVVVAVCLVILIGLFMYVANVDRSLRKMEKENIV